MGRIKELPSSSSHLLSCTQVITSINCVVKELVENAIDSFSKNIEIKLEDYGLDKIEVKDSGSGIHKDDISKVAKPHCTSKIRSHLDLNEVQTYGFRGEALSALCALSDLLIITKTSEEEFGFSYLFDHKGNVISSKPCPCTQGTTVSASNLFKNVPVRKQYYRTDKAKKEELKKVEDILITFACIHPDLRLALFHNQSLIWQKPTVKTIREGLVAIFGHFIVDFMENCEFTDENSQMTIEVFLPKHNSPPLCSSTSTNRSIISINKRPVRMKAIDKILKEYFNKSQSFSKHRYPICYIAIKVPPSETDVNIEPNKTTVMLNNLDAVIEKISDILKTFYDINPITEAVEKHDQTLINSKFSENSLDQNSNSKSLPLDSNLKKSDINLISSPFIPGTQNLKSKCLSRKLTRQSDGMSTPATKKIKTLNIPCIKPNELSRHIKTLDSFLQSSESNDQGELTPVTLSDKFIGSETPQDIMKPKECNISSDVSISITSLQQESARNIDVGTNPLLNNHPNINECHISVAAQRNNLAQIKSSDKLSTVSMSEAVLNSEINKIDFISAEINNNFSKHFEENPELDADQSIILTKDSPENNKKNSSVCNENFFKTAKSILEENCENEDLKAIVDQDWSRGKHLINNLEPVTVLKQQVVESVESYKKSPLLKEKNDKKQSDNSVTNQRRMTAFDFFCRKHRLEIASLHPHMNNNQLAQVLSGKWNNLTSDEKTIYKNMVDKDYPQNVKNKEKLGKHVSQNLSKVKEIAIKSKKKIRRKYPQKIIPFEVDIRKNFSSTNSREVACEEFNIISCVSPGIWIFSHQDKVFLLNTFRLQEIIIYQRLLETFKFEPESLEFPCIVSTNSLGEKAMEMIICLYEDGNYSDKILLDERIIANGFKINVIKNEEVHIQIIGMTRNIALYGVLDLKEILKILKEKGTSAKLSECRPEKVKLYLQNEAIRMARQCPTCTKVDFLKDMLEKMKGLPPNCNECIHSKPFMHEICKIS